MIRDVVLALCLLLAGLGAALAIVPSGPAHVLALFQDAETEKAGVLNDQLLSETPSDIGALYDAALLRGAAGDIAGATRALEQLVAQRPGDPQALRLLAQHYDDIGQVAAARNMLARIAPADMTAAERDALLAGYRYDGLYDQERGFLTQLLDTGLATEAQIGRLGLLLASADTPGRALGVLARLDDMASSERANERLTLLDLLLTTGQTPEAVRRARLWSARWPDTLLTSQARDAFAVRGLPWPGD